MDEDDEPDEKEDFDMSNLQNMQNVRPLPQSTPLTPESLDAVLPIQACLISENDSSIVEDFCAEVCHQSLCRSHKSDAACALVLHLKAGDTCAVCCAV